MGESCYQYTMIGDWRLQGTSVAYISSSSTSVFVRAPAPAPAVAGHHAQRRLSNRQGLCGARARCLALRAAVARGYYCLFVGPI